MEPPAPKCTDVAAIPNTDRIYQLFASIAPTKHENVQDADIACGIPVIQSVQSGFNSTYDGRFTLVNQNLGPKYGLHNGKYYGGVNNGGLICYEDVICSTLAGEGYVDLISGTTGQYCCKHGAFYLNSSYALSELNDTSKCKPRPINNSSYGGSYHRTPYYYCSTGTLSGTKCYYQKFTCPTDYKLLGRYCVSTKTKCPEGYKLDEIKDEYEYSCIGTKYTCPTNFDYTLSGDKCLCKKK